MARLNVEEKWWSDPRRPMLLLRFGCLFKTDGVMLNAWKLAEHYWCPRRQLIPINVWKSIGIPDDLFDLGLAEIRDECVYVKGTEEQFAWRFKKKKAAKQGGAARVRGAKRDQAGQFKKGHVAPTGDQP